MAEFKAEFKDQGATGISERLVSLLNLLAANALKPTLFYPGSHLLRRLTRGYQHVTPTGVGFFTPSSRFLRFLNVKPTIDEKGSPRQQPDEPNPLRSPRLSLRPLRETLLSLIFKLRKKAAPLRTASI
ncbi:hypothetical protein [Cyclobacterium roseum]|uniref:hypothetical protein n=1 Tax=Cyclobacterium roseum TaxID=2666137 RepID=UPI001391DD42|nr:hypothetical protein [Cyclobacterium roseum]